jgi:hypothetical protein
LAIHEHSECLDHTDGCGDTTASIGETLSSRSVKVDFVFVFSICILGFVVAIMRLRVFLKVAGFHDITFESVESLR